MRRRDGLAGPAPQHVGSAHLDADRSGARTTRAGASASTSPTSCPAGSEAGLRAVSASAAGRLAWTLLTRAGDGPPRPHRRHRTRDVLVAHLEDALRRASRPRRRVGVFLDEAPAPAGPAPLGPAATLAVLARRSGPLYLPARALDPSLVDPQPLVLFFPEDHR